MINKTRIIQILTITLFFIAVFHFVEMAYTGLTTRYQIDYGEGPLLDQAVRIWEGENLYRHLPDSPPYVIVNYPPVYSALWSLLLRITGPSFVGGRLISVVSVVISAVLVSLITIRLTGNRFSALIAGVSFIVIPYVAFWSTLARVDTLGLCLTLATLYFGIRAFKEESKNTVIIAAVFSVLAVFTRQTYVFAVPVTLFLFLLINGKWRYALLYSAACIIGGLLFLALFQFTSEGGFWFHIFTANANTFSFEILERFFSNLFRQLWFYLFLALVAVVMFFRCKDRREILPLLFLGTSFLTALLIGKVGSNVNYFLEFCAALALAAGYVLHKIQERRVFYQFVLLMFTFQLASMSFGSEEFYFFRMITENTENQEEILQRFSDVQGPVLVDEYMGLLPLIGKHVVFQPFVLSQMAADGTWDQSHFLEQLEAQRFNLIAILIPRFYPTLPEERWTEEMLRIIDSEYSLEQEIGDTHLYVPLENQ
ncbi:MAG: ArnT family glycosyltransferase [Spirochaetia bacterium]